MDKEKVIALSSEIGEDVKFAQEISAKIVTKHSAELDSLLQEVKDNIVDVPNPDDRSIEHYLLQLTNALYVINTQIDNFSFYDAISAANVTISYNEKYAESQMQAAAQGKKLTKDDHQQYAENQTVDEKMLNLIYNRSVKILKNKIDGAYEMVDVLKRILKHHEQEAFYDKQSRRLVE